MDTTIRYALFFSADVVLIGCLAVSIYMSLWNPTRLVIFSTSKNPYGHFPNGFHDYRSMVYFFVCLIGFGIFIYSGLDFLFSWMPHPWAGHTGSGTMPQTLAMMGAFISSIALVIGLDQNSRKKYELEVETEILRHSFKYFDKQSAALENSLARISRESSTKPVSETLDELERDALEIQNKLILLDRFKDKSLPSILGQTEWGDHRLSVLYYRIDVEPVLRLLKIVRYVTLPQ